LYFPSTVNYLAEDGLQNAEIVLEEYTIQNGEPESPSENILVSVQPEQLDDSEEYQYYSSEQEQVHSETNLDSGFFQNSRFDPHVGPEDSVGYQPFVHWSGVSQVEKDRPVNLSNQKAVSSFFVGSKWRG